MGRGDENYKRAVAHMRGTGSDERSTAPPPSAPTNAAMQAELTHLRTRIVSLESLRDKQKDLIAQLQATINKLTAKGHADAV
jgi:hypothetical protein